MGGHDDHGQACFVTATTLDAFDLQAVPLQG